MKKYLMLLLALAIVPMATAARQAVPPAPIMTPVPSPSPAPTESPTTAATPTPTPIVTPVIGPAVPSSLPTPLLLGPNAPPQILAITVNQPVFHSGDNINSTVITSTNVAAVELRVLGRVIRFPRVDFGIWELNYQIPHIPRRMLHDYAGQIVAMNSVGVTIQLPVTISLR